jgi:spore maturation protein CgeB
MNVEPCDGLTRMLIVGFSRPGHMGDYLARAAARLGVDSRIMDAGEAESRTRVGRAIAWRYQGKKPGRIGAFGDRVIRECQRDRYNLVLTTGIAPLEKLHIGSLRALGATVVNYSTDDPWNPNLIRPWFQSTMPCYNGVFTTRRANVKEFRRAGVGFVEYLPFGYDEEIHRPALPKDQIAPESDVLFVGGCDDDRLPIISALIDEGLNLALFGGYWNRHRKTRPHWRGLVDQQVIRAASASTRVCLCLVRRANRDEHVMRSFEAAAIGGCILAEDTSDHRLLFGKGARYFKDTVALVREAKELLKNGEARVALTRQLQDVMNNVGHLHTYASRLRRIIDVSLDYRREGGDRGHSFI